MTQLRTDDQPTRVTLRDPNSSQSFTSGKDGMTQKQLFIDKGSRDTSNDVVNQSSFLGQTPYYTTYSASAVSEASRKVNSTSPFNFSIVDKQRESANSVNQLSNYQKTNNEAFRSDMQNEQSTNDNTRSSLNEERKESLRDNYELPNYQIEERKVDVDRYDSRHLPAESLQAVEPKYKRNDGYVVTRKEVQALPIINWNP